MATHSSVLAWRIPGTREPGGFAVYGVAQSWPRLKQFSSSSSRDYLFASYTDCSVFSLKRMHMKTLEKRLSKLELHWVKRASQAFKYWVDFILELCSCTPL